MNNQSTSERSNPMPDKPCGGCGAETERDRCIGCFHDFTGTKTMSSDKPANVEVPERPDVEAIMKHSGDWASVRQSLCQWILHLESELAATARELAELREENNLLAGRINDLRVIADELDRRNAALLPSPSHETEKGGAM